MSKGFWAADSIAQSIERVGDAARRSAEIDEEIAWRKQARADYQELALDNAANLAEKHALRVALAKLDPNHPLVTNTHLQERIHKAAEQVFALSGRSWIDVGNVGRDFKY